MRKRDTIYCLGCEFRTDSACWKRPDAILEYSVMVNRKSKPPYTGILKRIIPSCFSYSTHVRIPVRKLTAEGRLL